MIATMSEVIILLDQGLDQNYDLLKMKIPELLDNEKMMIYDEKKKDAAVPFLVNFIVGFGIGSYIEGDPYGGTIQLIGSLAGLGTYVCGAVLLTRAETSMNSILLSGGSVYNSMIPGAIVMAAGALDMIGFGIFGWIRPWVFAGEYNSKLQSLFMPKSVSINVEPYFRSENNNQQVGLQLGLSF
jgi:hypothetical protein